ALCNPLPHGVKVLTTARVNIIPYPYQTKLFDSEAKKKISCRQPVAHRIAEALRPPKSGTTRHAGFRGARGVRRNALAPWERGLRINFRYSSLGNIPKSIGRRVHHV